MDFAQAIVDEDMGTLLEYKQLRKHPYKKNTWQHSNGNENGRLTQGMLERVQGTNTIFFVNKQDVPKNRQKDVTYARISCNYQPGKAEPNRTTLTIVGNRINYSEDCRMPTANLLTIKLLLNSIISTKKAKFMTMDAKLFISTPHSNGMNTSTSSWQIYCLMWQSNMS